MKRQPFSLGAIVMIPVIIAAAIVVNSGALPTTGASPVAKSLSNNTTSRTGFNADPNIQLVAFAPGERSVRDQQALYESCTVLRGSTPTPEGSDAPTVTPTIDPAALAPTKTSGDNVVFYKIVAEESEACYQVGEIFANGNEFNLAIGVTKTIDGEVAIDMNNVANSQIGDFIINVSEFKSDSDRRDGMIRQRFLESNKYPYAKLTEANIIGLSAGPYKEGDVLKFKVVGKLELHGTARETTFDATARLQDGTLVVIAASDVKMSDYGFDAPDIAGVVKANDELHIILNLVAREEKGDATQPAP
ncbi:MAG: YceI family protein [Chloroflexota bacterium]